LVVGDSGGFTITFTSSSAVETFLPQGGSPDALSQSYTDPISKDVKSVLAGQVTALSLSVGFYLCSADFAPPAENLGDQTYCSNAGNCKGMKVQEVLDLGNQALGGTIPYPYTFSGKVFSAASDVNQCLSTINENYVDGTEDNGAVCSSKMIEEEG
jgi:hypothetical protein